MNRPLTHAGPAILSAVLLCSLLLPAEGSAQPVLPTGPRVSDARLDALRGGYDVNSLLMSIGIARVVFINGEPVVTTTLNIPALNASIAGIRAAAVRIASPASSPVTAAASAPPQKSGAMPTSGVSAPPTSSASFKPAAASTSPAVASATRNANPMVTVGSGGLAVIQNGAGNTIALQTLPSAGTIIQNTLDNQSIRSVTTIDAKVFTQSIMQGMNLSASMNEAFKRPVTR